MNAPAVPLFPEQASSIAPHIDALFFALLALSTVIVIGIAGSILWFAFRYRRGSGADRSNPPEESTAVEVTWIVIPVIISVGLFAWGATLYVDVNTPPKDALEITVVGKQWMWKFQHPEGPREINDLHLPLGRPVKLVMTSQDVVHSLFVPAFRIKKDVVPGRYTTVWFTPTRPGVYHIFCAQYCGTDHAMMRGHAYVLDRAAYGQWLAGAAPDRGRRPLDSGRALFEKLRCATCHLSDGHGVGPALEGVYGRTVQLDNGMTVRADENYLRDAILTPAAHVVRGYPPVMPTFQGQVDDQELGELITYIKSLSGPPASAPADRSGP